MTLGTLKNAPSDSGAFNKAASLVIEPLLHPFLKHLLRPPYAFKDPFQWYPRHLIVQQKQPNLAYL
jgi:hypothetical protein